MFRDIGNQALGPYTQGELTDPTAGTVTADSGAVALGGNYEVIVTLGASAPAQFQLQRRNAANGANVGNVPIIYGPAGQSGQYRFLYRLEPTERVRVVMDDNLTGTAVVSLNLEQLS